MEQTLIVLYLDDLCEIKVEMFWIGGHRPTIEEPYATDKTGNYRIDVERNDNGDWVYTPSFKGEPLGEPSTNNKEIKKRCVQHHYDNK